MEVDLEDVDLLDGDLDIVILKSCIKSQNSSHAVEVHSLMKCLPMDGGIRCKSISIDNI